MSNRIINVQYKTRLPPIEMLEIGLEKPDMKQSTI